jgi:hypothetical protein
VFAESAAGSEKFITLENNLMKVRISTLGGKIYSVELKGYKRFNGQPLVLFEGNKNHFGLNFFSQNKSIQTDNFYFRKHILSEFSIPGNWTKPCHIFQYHFHATSAALYSISSPPTN